MTKANSPRGSTHVPFGSVSCRWSDWQVLRCAESAPSALCPRQLLRPPFTPFPPVKILPCVPCVPRAVRRPTSSVLRQIACAAIRDRRDPRSPRHGLESPCHVARAFQPVGLGRAVRSAVRCPPILAPFALLCGQPSVVPHPTVICRAAARFSDSTVHRQRHPNSTSTTNTDNGIAHANPRMTTHPSTEPITAKTPYTTVTSK